MSASNLGQEIDRVEQRVRGLNVGALDIKSRRRWVRSLRESAKRLDPDRQRTVPTEEQRKDIWRHLTYEVEMLGKQGDEFLRLDEIKRGSSDPPESVQNDEKPKRRVLNALNEAFYIHARALDEFLYPKSATPRPDTALAKHLVSDWPQRTGDSPLVGDEEVTLRDRVNIEIVHLSYRRHKEWEHRREWPKKDLMKKMSDPLHRFADSVQSNPDAKDFREAVRHFCELHG